MKVNTGDRKLDSYPEKIDEKANADPDGFFRQLSRKHGTPEEEIRQAMEQYRLSYGDTYMATGLFRISKKPIGVVAEEYKQNRGRGRGVTATSLGIKPGSPEFNQLKANARGSLGHMKAMAKVRKGQEKIAAPPCVSRSG